MLCAWGVRLNFSSKDDLVEPCSDRMVISPPPFVCACVCVCVCKLEALPNSLMQRLIACSISGYVREEKQSVGNL